MKRIVKGILITYSILFIATMIIAFINMIIDHKCYVMDDETFYSSKMCKDYWEERKNGRIKRING